VGGPGNTKPSAFDPSLDVGIDPDFDTRLNAALRSESGADDSVD